MLRCLLFAFLFQGLTLFGQNERIPSTIVKGKLSPGALLFVQHPEDMFLFPTDASGKIPVLVQLTDDQVLPPGIPQQHSRFGNIVSTNLSAQQVAALSADPNVLWIEASYRWNRVKMQNDTARVLSRVNEVQDGLNNGLEMNYTGTGVIVGIVDIGFQPDNPNFLNADGSQSRIKRYWHQSEKKGPAPTGFAYGTEFSAKADILAARDDDGTHGTHVGGISAGSGFTTPNLKYRGMAPDADLVFVTIRYSNDSVGGSALGDYVVANPAILDAYKYVFDYATSVGKPAVCNLSWGMHTGPHDGTSLFDKAVENLTGPGKLVVGAAGNDGGNQIHVSAQLNGDTAYTYAVDRSRNDYKHENIYMDVWGDSAATLGVNIALFDTLGNFLLDIPFFYGDQGSVYKRLATNGTDSIWYTMAGNPSFVNNKKPEITFMVETNKAVKQRIRIGITGSNGFHAWNSGQAYRWTGGAFLNAVKGNNKTGIYLNGTQQYSVGENGGTGKATISVGSYIARNNWIDFNGQYRSQNWLQPGDVSGFSSRGNTVDGRLKPDISAPGQMVASSVNYRTFPGWMAENTPYKSTYNGNDQYWTLLSGTSMAAPHVAGIVALMLQADPLLAPEQVRSILTKTAYRDTFTGKDSNIHFGYGKVDALAAVKMVVKLQTEKIRSSGHAVVFPNPGTDQIHFLVPEFAGKFLHYQITDIGGKLCKSGTFMANDQGMSILASESLTNGIYLYQLSSSGSKIAGKFVITR